jgi:SAM-dependent methyltransferase
MNNKKLAIACPECDSNLQFSNKVALNPQWCCKNCGFRAVGKDNYIDLFGDHNDTSAHYSLQWGKKLGFLEFIQKRPKAKNVMPASKLGWNKLFEEIRERSKSDLLCVYDAACGFGGIAQELINKMTASHIFYLGADIHDSLNVIAKKVPRFNKCGFLLRWDISRPLPIREKFDYVLCRASLHHTPEPEKTFSSICSSLKQGGKIAISVYNKKSVCREASDDALRNIISKMAPEEAYEVCHQFTILGKAFQKVKERVTVDKNLPLLGIKKGEYDIHTLLYYHFLKCFYNKEFGDQYSTLVNFDWYHPPFAHRYELDEVKKWFHRNKISIIETVTIDVQHFLAGLKSEG